MKTKLSTIQVAEAILKLRPLDTFAVSRYRQAMRVGAWKKRALPVWVGAQV